MDAGLGLEDGAAAVLAVAHRARALAERVRAGAAVVRRAEDDAWRGPAADAARAAQHDLANRLERCAAQLDEVSGAAVAHARVAGDRAQEIERLVRQARSLVEAVSLVDSAADRGTRGG